MCKLVFCQSKLTYIDTLELQQIDVIDNKKNIFDFTFLKDVVNFQIYSGKKNELIIVDDNLSPVFNNTRQIYNQVVSLNIYYTDAAGLQLNIGGRGLDPRRTSNFNIRQNYYDISADPLGYPESYYTPPYESLNSIELIRGAASLQYGTQFGGFINFQMKKPVKSKKIQILSKNTIASNNMYSHFTSLSGVVNRLGYYIFYNKKKGDGFRLNTTFLSHNFYSFLSYNLNQKMKISFEFTYLDYLAQQPGGLTDEMFQFDIFQSNRERNWFQVNWLLYNFQFSYNIKEETSFLLNTFLLDAHREAVGFRTNRVDQIDSFEERDLLKANFDNIGFETRLIHRYNLFDKKAVFLIGNKIFYGNNSNEQGPGSDGFDPNFCFQYLNYPNYPNQSKYNNPNTNFSIFSENVFYLSNNMSLTPGIRFEYIKTSSEGYYRDINTNAAGDVILNEVINTDRKRTRSFFLVGLGYNFDLTESLSIYSNCSQNYRAITFSDINIVNPSFTINPNITDENGYTFDLGFRGHYNDFLIYDISSFLLFYNNRIGFIQKLISDGSIKNEKGNVGDAKIQGLESLLNFNLSQIFRFDMNGSINYFINTSIITSKYINSQENGIEGNFVEFVPKINFKTGLKFKMNNFTTTLQYLYLSDQFTDATNSIDSDLSGVIGQIPAYDILDFNISYMIKNMKFEFGVNNVLDRYYFTNRATGYPGPGIIPSPNRNLNFSFELKF